jgi:UDP-2,3-diacylglucosamine hydrolase
MREKPVYVASDMHLGAVPPEREGQLVRWLEFAAERASRIVINGDLFDFWFEYRHAIPRGHTRILGALARAVDAGVPILLMGGNHDWWGGSYLREEVGVEFRQDPVVVELAGRRTLVAHGDGLGPGDLGYRMLRLMLRGRLTRWAFRWMHPDLGARIARAVSQTAQRYGEPSEAEKTRAACLREWAIRKIREEPALELVILGHSHIPTVEEVEPGRFYVNAGDWIRRMTYVIVEREGPPKLERWMDGTER